MKRILQFSILWLLLLPALAGCSRSFTIKGRVKGLDGQSLHVAWLTAGGVREQWVKCEKDRFVIEGATDELTLVTICTSGMQLLARLAVENGDHLQLRGDLSQPFGLEIKGPDVDERWLKFIADHSADYQNAASNHLNQAIEDYVKAHPSDVLSALLVLVDYDARGDWNKASKLLEGLDEEAKPTGLVESCLSLIRERGKPNGRLNDLSLGDSHGGFSTVRLSDAPVTLLYFWRNDAGHRGLVEAIKSFRAPYGKRLQVADVYVEPDTMGWSSTLRAIDAHWAHYWAPGGPLDKNLRPLEVQSLPAFALVDSAGTVHYCGPSLNVARGKARSLLK